MNESAQHEDLSQLEALNKAKAEASPKCLEDSADAGSGISWDWYPRQGKTAASLWALCSGFFCIFYLLSPLRQKDQKC